MRYERTNSSETSAPYRGVSRVPLLSDLSAIARLLGLVLVTLTDAFIGLIGGVILHAPAKRARLRNWCFRHWSRSVARLAGLTVRVAGTAPAPPFLLVSNHLSYMDIITLALHLDPTFVSKSEVGNWPLFGWASRTVGTIFITRETKRDLQNALSEMERGWEEGRGIVLFAEGTTSAGCSVAKFKPGLLELAARNRLPVHYACIQYRTFVADRPASQTVCWWGEMKFFGHLYNLFKLGGFEAQLTFGAEPLVRSDRKELADALHNAVLRDFQSTK